MDYVEFVAKRNCWTTTTAVKSLCCCLTRRRIGVIMMDSRFDVYDGGSG